MNDLRQRLERLADAGADGIEVVPPELVRRGRRWSWMTPATTAALVVVAVIVSAVVLADDEDEGVVTSDDVLSDPATAVVAVAYGYSGVVGDPIDLRLTFLDADGEVTAERSWSEVEEGEEGLDGVTAMRGLLQELPVGDVRLTATLVQGDEPISCTQPFTVAAGDRLVVRLQLGLDLGPAADPPCALVQSVDEWVGGRTSESGVAYLGLTEAEATTQAEDSGLTTRVVGVDGADLPVTMDLREGRLDLMVFDGVVVAAQLPTEPVVEPPAG